MSANVTGQDVYELLRKDDVPLTDAQADALVNEYLQLGLRYKKCKWKGSNCLITKAPREVYRTFKAKQGEQWEEIRERAGYQGLLSSNNNANAQPGTVFLPSPEWPAVVAFIDANYSNTTQAETKSGKSWWQFWKA